MPTLRGLVFGASGVLVLGVGLARDELGAVIWGAGVTALFGVVAAVALVAGFGLRRRRDGFSAELEQAVVETGSNVDVRVAVPRLRLAPGFFLTHEIALAWDARRLVGSAGVVSGSTARWRLVARARGDYRSIASALALRDVFGFTVSHLADPKPMRLVVLPADSGDTFQIPARRGGEVAATRSESRVQSEELREVRPYVPGDDPRRVSWKHFAVHRELLVREGELAPPTRGRATVMIDGHLPPGAEPAGTGDALMAALRALARQAGAAGVQLACRFPGRVEPVAFDEGGSSTDATSTGAAAIVAGFLPEPSGSEPVAEYRALGTGSAILLTARQEATAVAPVALVVSVHDRLAGRSGRSRRRSVFLREVR